MEKAKIEIIEGTQKQLQARLDEIKIQFVGITDEAEKNAMAVEYINTCGSLELIQREDIANDAISRADTAALLMPIGTDNQTYQKQS